MAEVKNAFIKSKMNKDLDARLLPTGEYRDAMNIAVSKSEGPDVGAVENIKGNQMLIDVGTVEGVSGLDVIGFFPDESSNRIFIFSTNSNVTTSPYEQVALNSSCFIHVYNIDGGSGNSLVKLVEGSFLNFTKTSFITGVNLLESLLFFTDNRNQPRVINVDQAIQNGVSHYTTEDHISVAKFAPYLPINILNKDTETVTAATTNSTTFVITNSVNSVEIGDFVSQGTVRRGIVESVIGNTVTLQYAASMATGPVVFKRSTMVNKTSQYLNASNGQVGDVVNPNYDATWEGDPDFLQDKFVRFSYRFKFEDNEFSLLAPFTSPIFIPKQFGYFVGGAAPNDEELTYKSSIVAFMENFIQEVDLKIPIPSNQPISDYKISEIDIVYKESDNISLQVLTTLQVNSTFINELVGDENYYTYQYQSKKPYRTLPNDVVTRVFDKVPIKAQSQEVISNRVVYANYQDKNNGPLSLDYRVVSQEKDYAIYDLTGQYPYHSLKQNRTYQVGVVLSDRYGRSTSVLLSTKDINEDTLGRGSSIFNAYTLPNDNDPLLKPFGDALRIIFEQGVPELAVPSANYPGAYADSTGKLWSVFDADEATISFITGVGNTYTFSPEITNPPTVLDLSSFLSVGDYLKGKYVDYTKITSINYSNPTTTIVTENQIADYYADTTSDDTVFGYKINTLGWYSYKIVVKQTEQDYYNVYLPLVVNGQFDGAANNNPNEDQQAEAVLINDNINKVPRDLSEVGPEQRQFRSSVRLFGRVTPERGVNEDGNEQWYPAVTSDKVLLIGTTLDLAINNNNNNIYLGDSKPLISIISSEPTSVGTGTFGRLPASSSETQNLSIYETVPTTTPLELFYETSTSGLVSELNREIANSDSTSASGVINFQVETGFNESIAGLANVATNFSFISASGTELDEVDIPNLPTVETVINGNGTVISPSPFSVVAGATLGTFSLVKLATSSDYNYIDGSETALDFDISIRVITVDGSGNETASTIVLHAAVANVAPTSTSTSYDVDNLTIDAGAEDDEPFLSLTDNTVITGEPSQLVGNGTSLASPNNLIGLVYSISNQQRTAPGATIDVDKFFINSDGEIYRKANVSFSPDEEYEIDVLLKDAGGVNVNTLTTTITVGLQFVTTLNNWGDGISALGVGCENASVSSKNEGLISLFGAANTSSYTNLPPSATGAASPNGYRNNPEEPALTKGSVYFQLYPDQFAESGTCAIVTHMVWIQYRANNSSTWTMAVKDNGSVFPSGGDTIDVTLPQTGGTKVPVTIPGEYSTPGEYRVILAPDTTGDALCGSLGCVSDTPLTRLQWVDPNI